MGLEIEKKFLVKNMDWKEQTKGTFYRQGYLSSHKERTVRIRTIEDKAYLTIKGISKGAVRSEYEYEIPYDEAMEILVDICEKPIIEKVRYIVMHNEVIWEIDEFEGENAGLIVAEVELADENQPLDLPPWIGEEVTADERYFNANLIRYPYARWK